MILKKQELAFSNQPALSYQQSLSNWPLALRQLRALASSSNTESAKC